MPASVNYSLTASTLYFARTRAEADAFFDGLNVSDATTGVPGVVKQSGNVAFTTWAAWDNEDTVTVAYPDGAGGLLTAVVPSSDHIEDVKAKVNELRDFVVALKASLIASGALEAD